MLASFLFGNYTAVTLGNLICENEMSKNFLYFIILLAISGCGTYNSSSKSSKTSIPKTTQIPKPGGNGENWRYLGTTDDGVLVDEINVSSISSTSSAKNTQVFNFEDRKTVILPNQFAYPSNQPRFKYLLSTWQMDCNSKEYLMTTTTLYNESGTKLTRYDYANDSSVKWLKLGSGSFAEMQYNFICLNINRNLGY